MPPIPDPIIEEVVEEEEIPRVAVKRPFDNVVGRRFVKVRRTAARTGATTKRYRARKTTIKQRILKEIRARRKVLNAELKVLNRDYKSLICRRRKKKQ